MACFWFSQPTSIPGPPTLPQRHRTFNVDVSGGPKDWTAHMPWRAPGSAPVLGSGCGRQIDRADAVWRVNNPPYVGFEADVGSRTTLSILANVAEVRTGDSNPQSLHATARYHALIVRVNVLDLLLLMIVVYVLVATKTKIVQVNVLVITQ